MRAVDPQLGRATRQSPIFFLVVESLYARYENRSPAIPDATIQQMLRAVEDEVRAHAALAVRRS
jgi:hypothetical protein